MKLLVVGYDGLSVELMKQLSLGRSLQMLGVLRPMKIEIPVSGPSWMTLYTGLSATEHGVLDALGYGGKKGEELTTYADLTGRCVWDILGDNGITVGLCNLPCAHPVREVNGFHVGGFPGGPWTNYRWPQDIHLPLNWLEKCDWAYYGEPIQDPEFGQWGHGEWGQMVRSLGPSGDLFEMAFEDSLFVARWFIEQAFLQEVEFGWLCFTFPDRIGHLFGTEYGAQVAICNIVTRTLHLLWSVLKPQSLLVVSDHGMQLDAQAQGIQLHTREGILGGLGPVTELIPPYEEIWNRDVARFILGAYGLSLSAGTSPTTELLAEAEDVVRERLKTMGYMK